MADEKKIPEGTGVPPMPGKTEGYGAGGYGEKAHVKDGYGAGGYGEKAHVKDGYGAGGYGEKAHGKDDYSEKPHGKEGYGAGRSPFGPPMGQQIQWMPVVVYIPVYAGQQPGFPMSFPGGMSPFGGAMGRPPMGPPPMMQPPMGRPPMPPVKENYGEKKHGKEGYPGEYGGKPHEKEGYGGSEKETGC